MKVPHAIRTSIGAMAAAAALIATQQPSALAPAQPGLWEIRGLPGTRLPVRMCVGDIAALARFEHRAKACTSRVISDTGTTVKIDYDCGSAGFGHSEIEVLTPRSLRIGTQGISGGLPFGYMLQARRMDDCPAPIPRH